MSFSPDPKQPGDLARAQDWNEAIDEVMRLENDKVNKNGDNITGALNVIGQVGIGTNSPARKLHVVGGRIRLENSGRVIDLRADGSAVDLQTTTSNLFIRTSTNHIIMNPSSTEGNIGIGTTSPGAKLHVHGNLRLDIGEGLEFIGKTNYFGTNLDARILRMIDVNGVEGNVDGGLAIEGFTPTDDGRKELLTLRGNGNLKITGNASKPGGGSWSSSSDRRLKKNIKPLHAPLSRLLQLKGVSFEWREPEKHGDLVGEQMGMIAQEVEEVFPNWVDADQEGFKTLTIRGFEALVVEAFRELIDEYEKLKAKNKELEVRLKALEEKESQDKLEQSLKSMLAEIESLKAVLTVGSPKVNGHKTTIPKQ